MAGGRYPAVYQESFAPTGGLDVVTPPLQVPSGTAISALNFEVDLHAGYSRIGGYDRYVSGRTLTELNFQFMTVTYEGANPIESGTFLVGPTGKVYAKFIGMATGGYQLTQGTWQILVVETSPDLQVGQRLMWTSFEGLNTIIRSLPAPISEGTYEERAEFRRNLRTFLGGIVESPWQAPGVEVDPKVYGLVVLNDTAVAVMRVASTGNAVFVTPDNQINGAIAEGRRWRKSVQSGLPLTINSRVEFVTSTIGRLPTDSLRFDDRAFGVTGTSQAFIFTQTGVETISTGMATDTPDHIAIHVNRLWLSFGPSLQFSALGDPKTWSPVVGAGEINAGSMITGLMPLTGESENTALLVSTERKLFILYGDNVDNFKLVEYADNSGALTGTLQWMGRAIFQNAFGLTTLSASQAFGGFASSSISSAIKPFLDSRRNKATASMIVRNKNQYRVFFEDGSGVYVTFRPNKNGYLTPSGMFPIQFPHKITCAWSSILKGRGTLPEGEELILVGTETGDVFRLDVGWSFNGEPIPWHLRLAFNHFRDPSRIKAFRRCRLEVQSAGYSAAQVGYDIDYRGPEREITPDFRINTTEQGANRFWSDAQWNRFRWDVTLTEPITVDTPGSGQNFSLRMAGEDAISEPFTLTGVLIDYVPRRRDR